jgi:hypothetical protein
VADAPSPKPSSSATLPPRSRIAVAYKTLEIQALTSQPVLTYIVGTWRSRGNGLQQNCSNRPLATWLVRKTEGLLATGGPPPVTDARWSGSREALLP